MKKGFTQHLVFKKFSNRKLSAGFTLNELLIVVAIIGIFSAVAVPSYLTAKAKARDAIRLGDLKSISLAIQNYWQDSGYTTWPLSLDNVSTYFSGGVPTDPSSYLPYLYTAFGKGGGPAGTDKGTNKMDFCLGAKMETIARSYPCNMNTSLISDQGTGSSFDYNYTYVGP